MGLINQMRRALFEYAFGTTESDATAKAASLRRFGVPEEQIAGFCRPGLYAGTTLGGAYPIDVQLVVEQVLVRQGAESVTLRVARDRHADGHLRVEVLEVGSPDEAAGGEGPTP
jgi:hypothetical protein